MAVLSIHPIHTQSLGGYPVLINGLDPTTRDCIVGEIDPVSGRQEARWNLSGLMSNGSDSCNLSVKSGEMVGLIALARHLGAT